MVLRKITEDIVSDVSIKSVSLILYGFSLGFVFILCFLLDNGSFKILNRALILEIFYESKNYKIYI